MRITLLDVQKSPDGHINRDLAGGYGSATRYGDSMVARLISLAKRKGVRLPPLVLGYLASIFKCEGHEVFFRVNEIAPRSDLVVILSSIVGAMEEMDMGDEIKKKSDARICYVGTFGSVLPQEYLKHGDSVIVGEPENAAISIAREGLKTGIIKSVPVETLDNLPFPFWDIFPVRDYSYFPMINVKPFLTMATSRGCPLPCYYYCPYTVLQGSKIRCRSIGNVVAELNHIRDRWGIRGLFFRDPIFTFNRDRSLELAKRMKTAGLNIQWACETHLERLDENLLDELYSAGLRAINVGIEGIQTAVMKRIKRKTVSLAHAEGIIRYCRKKGIHVSAFYILGSPADTEENIRGTIRYAQRLNTDAAQFTISTPYPGTQYYEDMKDLIDIKDWHKYTGFYSVFRHETITRSRLLWWKDRAYVSYYLRPRWLFQALKKIVRERFWLPAQRVS